MKINRLIAIVMIFVTLICASGCFGKDDDENISTEQTAENVTAEDTTTEEATEGSTEPIVVKAKEITLSGEAGDVIVIEEPSYIVSDRFIIYVDAGVELNGDAEAFIKSVMSSLEEVSGMTYDNELFKLENRESAVTKELKDGYDEAAKSLSDCTYFYGVDLEQEKMCVFITADSEDVLFYNNGVVLRQADLKPEGRRQAVNELAGMLCLRVGNVSLGDSIDGGMAGYLTQLLANAHPEYGVVLDGFSFYDGVERFAVTEKNASNMICTSHGFEADSIGFRFMIFINETYDSEVIKSVYSSCASYRSLFMGTNSGTVTMQKVVELIKKATSDNVFVDFYEWYKVNAVRFGDTSYIEAETSTEAESETETKISYEDSRDWQAYFEELFGK